MQTVLALLLFFPAQSLTAQTAPPAAPLPAKGAFTPPALLISDWRPVGIDPADLVRARKAMNVARNALIAAAGTNARTLTALAQADGQTITVNMKKISDRITAAEPAVNLPVPIIVEPVWCTVADRHVLMVTVSRSDNNELLGSAHTTIARDAMTGSLKSGGDLFSQALAPLFARAAAAAQIRAGGKNDNALHIGLSLAIPESRNDTGSGHCLNYLMEERLAPDYIIARSTGADRLASLRTIYRAEARMRRPTRLFLMQWQHPDERNFKRNLPLVMQLNTRTSESVYGHPTAPKFAGETGIALAADRTILIDVKPEFLALFKEQKNTLLLADWPQVAKIYGAWVYLDRGRAWGLKMNDRLTAMVDGQPVKGHVVRFFGPEQKLTSPRGFPIEEGAILYVRKGQKLPKNGLEFRFDPRQFPTTYPIQPGN